MGLGCGRADGLQEKRFGLRLGMGPVGGDGRSAAIVVAASAIADDELFRFGAQRIVAAMNSLANAAGVCRRSPGRQRQWGEIPYEREEQQ